MIRLVTSALISTLIAATAAAQETPALRLGVELNRVTQADNACRITLMVANGMGQDLSSVVLEAVLITRAGMVDRLTLFDLQDLPQGKARVRQFDLENLSCDALGQVLLNGVASCTAPADPALDARACAHALAPSSRTDVEMN
ncbi:MAG: hypothetical protein ACK5IB_02315 [Qingshengfaniella sp.]